MSQQSPSWPWSISLPSILPSKRKHFGLCVQSPFSSSSGIGAKSSSARYHSTSLSISSGVLSCHLPSDRDVAGNSVSVKLEHTLEVQLFNSRREYIAVHPNKKISIEEYTHTTGDAMQQPIDFACCCVRTRAVNRSKHQEQE